jgi:ABC-type transport system substrate-binding protein
MEFRRSLRIAGAVFVSVWLVARPLHAADDVRALRVTFPTAETSFDPAFASDGVSDTVIDSIMESMLEYDYLARPMKLVPRTLVAMPTVEDGATTFTFRLRKGIFFTPDAAFRHQPRELLAADYAYAIKRILDPAVRSPWLWLFKGKIVGGDEARDRAAKGGKFDYDAAIAGLEVVDRYTLTVRLKAPDLRFLYAMAVQATAAMAREVVEAYGSDIGAHPVGSGAYMLGEYRRTARIELVANPGFRDTKYVPAGPIPATSQAVAQALRGRRLPLTPRIDFRVIEEGQARWLSFLNGEFDVLPLLPAEFTTQAVTNGKLNANLAAQGIVHQPLIRPNVAFTYFNMRDPVVGGYTPDKIALRRAISLGFDNAAFIAQVYFGRAAPANGPIPPDIVGYDPALRTGAQIYDPPAARALLDKFGYKDRDGDGYREMPDGKPLLIERWSTPASSARPVDELWRKNMDAIGIRIVFRKDKLQEMRKMAQQGKIMTRGDGWNADYPDAENFMQLLYGPNAGQANDANFDLPEFNKLYEEATRLPDSPARTKMFDRMTELVVAYAPWRLTVNLIEDTFAHPWVHNYVPHPIGQQPWAYIDVDAARRALRK